MILLRVFTVLRLFIRYTIKEFRDHGLPILLAYAVWAVLALCWGAFYLPWLDWIAWFEPRAVTLACSAVFGLRMAAPGIRRSIGQRLPAGERYACAGKIAAMFLLSFGPAMLFLIGSIYMTSGRMQAIRVIENMYVMLQMAFTLGLWMYLFRSVLRNAWIAAAGAIAASYFLLLPIMWLLGNGEKPTLWDGLRLPVPTSAFDLGAFSGAAEHFCGEAWGTLFAVAAAWTAWSGRGRDRRAQYRAVGIAALVMFAGSALGFWQLAEDASRSKRRALVGRVAGTIYISPDETRAYLAKRDHGVVVDLESGVSRTLEGFAEQGRLMLPFGPGAWDRGVHRDVPVLAHVAYKAGRVNGWNLLDTDRELRFGRYESQSLLGAHEARVRDSRRRASRLFLSDGRKCWLLRESMEVETAGGFVRVPAWKVWWRITGVYGFVLEVREGRDTSYFDLVRQEAYSGFGVKLCLGLGVDWLVKSLHGERGYFRYDPETEKRSPAPGLLRTDEIIAVLMDGRILALDVSRSPMQVVVVDLANGHRQSVAVPAAFGQFELRSPFPPRPGLLALTVERPRVGPAGFAVTTLDPKRLELTAPVRVEQSFSVPDEQGWVYSFHRQLEKVNLLTGERINLMPRKH